MDRKNAFLLAEALFALLILLISISLLWKGVDLLWKDGGWIIDEKINKEWFYND